MIFSPFSYFLLFGNIIKIITDAEQNWKLSAQLCDSSIARLLPA